MESKKNSHGITILNTHMNFVQSDYFSKKLCFFYTYTLFTFNSRGNNQLTMFGVIWVEQGNKTEDIKVTLSLIIHGDWLYTDGTVLTIITLFGWHFLIWTKQLIIKPRLFKTQLLISLGYENKTNMAQGTLMPEGKIIFNRAKLVFTKKN